MEDNKESSTAVTTPATRIIQSTNNYDEESTLGDMARHGDGANSLANNNDSENAKGADGNDTVGIRKDEADFDLVQILSDLNLNSYATRKTIAQAILDLALLAANASQLKYILSVGEKHEFYHIILWLVVTSIVLQVVQAVVLIILALVLNINEVNQQKAADIVNNIGLLIVVLIVTVNVIISAFDIKGGEEIQQSYRNYS